MNGIANLVGTVNAAAVNPFVAGHQVAILLQDINLVGLRSRRFHTHGYAFVKVFVDGREVLKTDVNPEPTAPGWPFSPAKRLVLYPASTIQFCVFRHHRHTQEEEFIGSVEGTAWHFLQDTQARHETHSTDSPELTLQVISTIEDDSSPRPRTEEPIDIVAMEQHRIEVLNQQRRAHQRSGFVDVILPGMLDAVLSDLDGVLHLLEHISPAIPLSKIVVVLLRAVQNMVKAHGQVDSDIDDLMKTLRETLCHAAAHDSPAMRQQAVRLAGEGAAVVDGWVHDKSGKQLIKALHVQKRIKDFHQRLLDFNMKLKNAMKPNNSSRAPMTTNIELPERTNAEPFEPPTPDSPGPQTPPAIHSNLDSVKVVTAGSFTYAIKEIEEHLGVLHHPNKLEQSVQNVAGDHVQVLTATVN